MSKAGPAGRKLSVTCVIVAALAQFVGAPILVTSTPLRPVAPKTDIESQARILDNFVSDLFKLDKKSGELGKKASLTREEFDSLQTTADDLKRRLPELQNALQAIITKLKGAGEWEDIDSRVAVTISDAAAKTNFRQISFKRELEEAAAQLNNDATEINRPLDVLRRKLSSRAADSSVLPGSALAWPTVAVAYRPEPSMFKSDFRCRLASLRYGISGLTHGSPLAGADEAYKCACNIPSGYSCYSPY